MNTEFFMQKRVLFVVEGCPHCRAWKEFIERVNMKLPMKKRVEVIDCTNYYDFGIIEHSLIRAFIKYIKGDFPAMFVDGLKIQGGATRLEAEAYITTLLQGDFVVSESNPHIFNRDCSWEKSWFGKKIICQKD